MSQKKPKEERKKKIILSILWGKIKKIKLNINNINFHLILIPSKNVRLSYKTSKSRL